MQAIELLLSRNSHPRLTEPYPNGQALERLYRAALRAPDHAGLKPWRFIEFSGAGLVALGDIYAEAQQQRDASTDAEELKKLRMMAQRAPMIIAVVAKIQQHPKVPASEQLLSAGCAAHALLLAAEAEGFAGIWRSGWVCFDPHVRNALKLAEADELVGFIYLGTPAGRRKPLPDNALDDFVERWV
ncbi:MAG: nitroreductase family protein [Marinospirillum sp.]|uniref:nitroreductase family protein n=1 Tax=Marinospirillum sp. TaxID=2183934 RepID=UPI0019F5B187|nr:nitroreductase family protein [Marinospirillum sp.]MBE0507372.1 nitroreductase family protein [Marinospirillum sp.]